MTTCPVCDDPVLNIDGLLLNPKPGRLGRHLKDGTILTGNQIRDPNIRGYYQHQCTTKPATKKPQQEQTLF